jgi:hypothetical protein
MKRLAFIECILNSNVCFNFAIQKDSEIWQSWRKLWWRPAVILMQIVHPTCVKINQIV